MWEPNQQEETMTENIVNQETDIQTTEVTAKVHWQVTQREVETFSSGAVRDKSDYRYDLMSPVVVDYTIGHTAYAKLAWCLFKLRNNNWWGGQDEGYCLQDIFTNVVEIVILEEQIPRQEFLPRERVAHLYAQALHEGSLKYGERNWERGIPESNLVNHALFHLFKLNEGDTSENHLSHLVWNVMTIIHFREVENEKKSETP
jgi:hypothetical protein